MNLQKNIFKMMMLLCGILVLNSCASGKSILYIQNPSAVTGNMPNFENTLQPDDNLVITVTSDEPELAKNFNMLYLNSQSTEMRSASDDRLYSYTIDQRGEIDFPVLGKLKLAGLTRIQAEDKIKALLKDGYLANPGVNLKVINFKISVLGEVATPGAQNVVGDRITLLEALSEAGDLTIYGKRQNIRIIREKDGVQTITPVDITKADFINSPYYYLAHNDVVIVDPNKTRINSSVVGPNLTVGLSALSLLLGIIALTTR
jgi:polysaccharide export outer membrane protein